MGRASAATPTKRKDIDAVASAEDKADELESKRLRDRAFSRGFLSQTKSNPGHTLRASKTILKSDGRDIVKKGHRKTKFLFAFPGLMAPVAAGKVGDLSNLDSKNPILYIDFPQGRIKLFGTIVYPKNKYLTLHFARGAGNIICEDSFESLVVFSAAWWIGKKEENPEEVRLDWPKDLEQDKHADFDFTAGAGRETDQNTTGQQNEKDDPMARVPHSPVNRPKQPKVEYSESENGEDAEAEMSSPPIRQSARTAGRKLRYADSSTEHEEDDGDDTDSSESQQDLKKKKKMETQNKKEESNKVETPTGANATIILDSDGDTPKRKPSSVKAAQRNLSTKFEMTATPVSKDFLTAPIPEESLTAKPSSSRVQAKVLKQSKMEYFSQKPVLQETVTYEQSTPRRNLKASADVLMESSKDLKRPRKSPHKAEEADLGSSDSQDNSSVEVTPSKGRKRIKNDKSASARKGSVKGGSATPSKGKPSKDGKVKQQINRKPKKSAPGSTSGGKTSGKKSAASKSNMGSDSEAELSDSDEKSDDSDEDWVG